MKRNEKTPVKRKKADNETFQRNATNGFVRHDEKGGQGEKRH